MSATKCQLFERAADRATQCRAAAVWGTAYDARRVAGDDAVTAIEQAYQIELLFWVLSAVMGRRTT